MYVLTCHRAWDLGQSAEVETILITTLMEVCEDLLECVYVGCAHQVDERPTLGDSCSTVVDANLTLLQG